MRAVIAGLGNQGHKRMAAAGEDVVATVDPVASGAGYKTIDQVPLELYDAALVCTPDSGKLDILTYLLSHGKHVLVEKPLLPPGSGDIGGLTEMARSTGAVCYTAYNHRFEPHVARLRGLLGSNRLGDVYNARLFYGNGTAADVKESAWRDHGLGVLSDLGSHLLDLSLYLFGASDRRFEALSGNSFETHSLDHVVFGSPGKPSIQLEATLLSWRNTFTIDVICELGSAHIDGLCKWGVSTLRVRERVFPSGVPREEEHVAASPDPTWDPEYQYFKELCDGG